MACLDPLDLLGHQRGQHCPPQASRTAQPPPGVARSSLRRTVFFWTALDGGMRHSFVRQQNRTVSVGFSAPKPSPGKRLVKRSFYETVVVLESLGVLVILLARHPPLPCGTTTNGVGSSRRKASGRKCPICDGRIPDRCISRKRTTVLYPAQTHFRRPSPSVMCIGERRGRAPPRSDPSTRRTNRQGKFSPCNPPVPPGLRRYDG